MTVDAPAGAGQEVQDERAGSGASSRPALEVRIAAVFMALLPGLLIVYFSYRGGGFYPGSVGLAGLLVTQMLVLRVLVADDPFAGASRALLIVGGLFAAFTAWTLASGLWAGSVDRPLTEFNRALLYLVLLVLMGTLPRLAWRAAWLARGTAIGAFVICALGLTSRVLPHLLPTEPGVSNNRLSYPVTYWNALGLIAAIGAIIAIGIASSDGESRVGRALAAASVPIFAATLLFTFSRGAMIAFFIGLVAFLAIARQRAVVGGLLAIVPATAVAVVAAFKADQLATINPTTPAAVAQGKNVAIAVAVCCLAAGALRLLLNVVDRRVSRIDPTLQTRRRILMASTSVAAVVVAVALAAGGASWIGDQYDRFLHGAPLANSGDLRARLSDPSSNGRIDHWNAAFEGFAESRLHGTGAGTYQFVWEQHRDIPVNVVDAHGLYFETLSDLGIVGLLLLVGTIVGILVGLARRARGPNRGFYAALFAAGVVWTVHAGIDWDWEMPVVTAWLFAVGGAALASQRRRRPSAGAHRGRDARVPVAVGLLILAVTPVLMMVSQTHVSAASDAFYAGDCDAAEREALSAISRLATRPEPYQVLGYCNMERGRAQAAIAAMRQAIDRQPDSWEPRFGLALARAEGGADPRFDLAAAFARNPRENVVLQARAAFRDGQSPEQRQAAAEKLRVALVSSGRLALK
jgi:hypothetical protein